MATNPAFEPDDIESGNSACVERGDIGNEEIPKEADEVFNADASDDTRDDDDDGTTTGKVSEDVTDGTEKPMPDDFKGNTVQPESDNNDAGQSVPHHDEGNIEQVKHSGPTQSIGVSVFLIWKHIKIHGLAAHEYKILYCVWNKRIPSVINQCSV